MRVHTPCVAQLACSSSRRGTGPAQQKAENRFVQWRSFGRVAADASFSVGLRMMSLCRSTSGGGYTLLLLLLSSSNSCDALRAVSTSLPRPSSASVLPELGAIAEGYSSLTKEHYLRMAFLQSGVLACVADTMTQTMQSGAVNLGHVGAMAFVASTMSGVWNAICLRQLESAFPGTGGREVVFKTLIHAIIIASIINSAYLVGVPLLTRLAAEGSLTPHTVPAWCSTWQDYIHYIPPSVQHLGVFEQCGTPGLFSGWTMDEFITLTKLEVGMFIPYNTIAFKFVPPQVRPLTHAMISATFNVAVSAVTLGYFDEWCERATHLL
jgi:hypothetical protein